MEGNKVWNTVNKAYPAANAAKTPVKNTVAPIPTYLFASVGVRLRIAKLEPLQNQKNRVIEFIERGFEFGYLPNAKTWPKK